MKGCRILSFDFIVQLGPRHLHHLRELVDIQFLVGKFLFHDGIEAVHEGLVLIAQGIGLGLLDFFRGGGIRDDSADKAVTVKAMTLAGGDVRSQWDAAAPTWRHYLESSDDGARWQPVCRIPSGSVPQQTIDIPVTTARYFRLQVANPEGNRLYAALGFGGEAAESTTVHEWVLHTVTKVNHAEEKAGFAAPLEVGDVGALLAESVQFGNRERSVFRDDVGGDQLAEDPEYVLGVKEAVAAAARSSSPTSPGSRC